MMDKAPVAMESDRAGFAEAILHWLAAGCVFWFVECIVLSGPGMVTFGIFRMLQSSVILKSLAWGFAVYPLLFLLVGLAAEFVGGLLGRRFAFAKGAAWRVGCCVAFQVVLVGAIVLPELLSKSKYMRTHLVWELGLGVFAVLVLAVSIRCLKRFRNFSWKTSGVSALMSLWLLPVINITHGETDIVDAPWTLFFFIAAGLLVVILLAGGAGAGEKTKRAKRGGLKTAGLFLARVTGVAALVLLWRISLWAGAVEVPDMEAGKDLPNILFVVWDTVRADHVSCYGYERRTTPTLDRLAAEGVLFEQVMSASHWTLPSHASMFTGMYPGEHLATGQHPYLMSKYPTLAQILFKLGYRTAGFSANSWVGVNAGTDRGFEYFEEYGIHDKPSRIYSVWVRWCNYLNGMKRRVLGKYTKKIAPPSEEVTDSVIRWFDEYYDNKPDRPFFVFINLMDAHAPYHHPFHEDLGRFLPEGRSLEEAVEVSENALTLLYEKKTMTERDFELIRALYDAQIRHMDDQLARLVGVLKKHGLWEDTLVIVTSDHGEFFGERGMIGHGRGVGKPTLHVPLVIRPMEGFRPGARVSSLVQNIDLLPTILEILHVKIPGGNNPPGRSLSNPKKGRKGYADSYPFPFYLEVLRGYSEKEAGEADRKASAVWDNGYEYIWGSNGQREMYYLPEDPSEERNLIKKMPKRAKRMESEAARRAARSSGKPDEPVEINLSQDATERLRALGYIK